LRFFVYKLQTASDPATFAGKIKVKPIIGGQVRTHIYIIVSIRAETPLLLIFTTWKEKIKGILDYFFNPLLLYIAYYLSSTFPIAWASGTSGGCLLLCGIYL
jgi:hypothetical protein